RDVRFERGAVQTEVVHEIAGGFGVAGAQDLLIAAAGVRLGVAEDDGPVGHHADLPAVGFGDRGDVVGQRAALFGVEQGGEVDVGVPGGELDAGRAGAGVEHQRPLRRTRLGY